MTHRAVVPSSSPSLTQPQLVGLRLMTERDDGRVMWVRNFFGRGLDPSQKYIAKLTADKLVDLRLATRVPFDSPMKDRGVIELTDLGRKTYAAHRAQYQSAS